MSNVSEWSITAGLNNSSPPDGWPEGMQRSAVNDAAREMQAALARWYQDSNGSLVTAGTGNAYTLTTNNGYTAFADIPMLVFKTNRANTGPITLNVDGLGAQTVYRSTGGTAFEEFASGDLYSSQMMVVVHNPGGWWEYFGPSVEGWESGTVSLFQQTTAPTGWTKQTSHDNKALRLVTGTASSGGSTSFTSVFASRSILTANLPSHSHGAGTLAVGTGITFDTPSGATSCVSSGGSGAAGWTSGANGGSVSLAAHLSSGSVGGSTATAGSGTAMDFAVQYVDVILASKI